MAVSTIHHPALHTEPVRWQSYRKTESQHAAETAQLAPTAEWVLWWWTHQIVMCFQHVINFKSTKSDVVSFAQTVNGCSTSHLRSSQLHTASTVRIFLPHQAWSIYKSNKQRSQQGRAVNPRTPEHSGVEVPTPELFWGWTLFWDWELSSGVVSPNAMRGQLCINIFVSYNYSS